MNLDVLRTFLWVVHEGSVTRAARRVHLSQPAVSAQLAQLEAWAGTPLVHRHRRGVSTTDAGLVVAERARVALREVEGARVALDDLMGLRRGRLAIGGGATATTHLLPRVLGEFHRRHPAVQITVREQGSEAVLRSLLAGEIDVGVVTARWPGEPTSWPPQVRVDPWVQDELVLLVPPGDPLEGRSRFRWRDLAGRPLVLFEAGTAVRALIDDSAARAGVRVEAAVELRSIDAIRAMIHEGVGAGFVSRHALGLHERGALSCADGPLRRLLAVALRADRAASVATAAFVALLGELGAPPGGARVLRSAPPPGPTEQTGRRPRPART